MGLLPIQSDKLTKYRTEIIGANIWLNFATCECSFKPITFKFPNMFVYVQMLHCLINRQAASIALV